MQSLVTWAVEVDDIPKEPKRFCVLLRNRSELNKYYITKSRDSKGLREKRTEPKVTETCFQAKHKTHTQ